MAQEFAGILARYGQNATVYTRTAPEGIALRAFFQPVSDRSTVQSVPGPMGQVMQDRFLYLGPPEVALDCDGSCRVVVGGEVYRPQSVQGVYVGEKLSHWWAVLTRRAKEAAV